MSVQPQFGEIFKKSLEWFKKKHGEEKYQQLISLCHPDKVEDEEIKKVTNKCKRLTISKKNRKLKRI